ncbi:DUF3995 domain-containing protein [Xylanimonas allomyrinae]|uniref:DUF3995 domain-containing protein n=1 Tax=Xylanimonas allomyrinae TaxID=2509459 RepID=A0A4P6EP08_9MICO|nr:DUF3995 domain-containing protein [Xylanimonas allomyrinae]
MGCGGRTGPRAAGRHRGTCADQVGRRRERRVRLRLGASRRTLAAHGRTGTCRRSVGAGLLARAGAGGVAAARSLALPEPGWRFRQLDARYYRPLCAVLGAFALVVRAAPETT